MLRFPHSILPAILAGAASLAAQAVSPTDRTTLEGSSFTHFPLGRASARMQTLHADVPGGTVIHGHAYRRDAAGVRGLVDGFACDLEVTLSVGPNPPTQASTTFANNAGSAPVVVLPRTVLNFPATQRPSLDPSPSFELLVPYATPFVMPPQGGTLCVDVRVFGNTSAAGTNLNLSVYLDAHENYPDGRAEQAGFRTFQGCPAPGSTANSYATMTYWRMPTSGRLDVSIRDGVPDDGSVLVRPFVTVGHGLDGSPWPLRPDCPFWSTSEVWFALPGAMTSTGSHDGSLVGLPLLPPGYRLWAQAGSVHLGTVAMAFSDATTFVTPPAGPLPIPTARIVHSTNGGSATGTVSYAVPVMAFL
ncbi:MAG: hypothetical protein JNK15_22320 [Planctomycetes bacterium]|nr:hypothetical protein [Planctomycetota bacterium]